MRLPLALLALVVLLPTAAACDGLSPGDHIVTGTSSCTLAFLVANADGLYFATAGHCVKDGAATSSDDHGEIGVTVFRHLEPDTGQPTDGSPGEDFALIRIHEALYDDLNPKICAWDGPTGLVTDDSANGGGVRHHGYGMILGDNGATRAREGVNLYNDGNFGFYWTGAGVPGDSGSAVIAADGRALGVLTHVGIMPGPGETNGGTHLLRGFELAAEAGITDLRLVLAGEDPVAVLASLRGETPPAEPPTTPTPGTPTPTTPPSSATPPPSATPTGNGTAPPTPTGSDDGDGLSGATTDDDPPRGVPGAPLALILLAMAGVALRRRASR